MDLGMPEPEKRQQQQQDHQVSGDFTATITAIPREHMFDKSVTPSDVGKLNRLVIPKQHAEKHFPLDHHSSSNTKAGLLLNFEDRNGKSWRFRYSYWNSSQSYVITKGWSRFVKDKKLLAGDIVSFQRGLGDSGHGRLFIDWRRKPNLIHPHNFPSPFGLLYPFPRSFEHLHRFNNNNQGFNSDSYNNGMTGRCYLRSRQQISEVADVATKSMGAAGKRLRLFGVDIVECCDGSTASSNSAIEEGEESYSPKTVTRGETGYVHSSSCSVLQLGLPGNGTTADQEHGLVVIPKKIKPSLSLDLDCMP